MLYVHNGTSAGIRDDSLTVKELEEDYRAFKNAVQRR